MNKKTTQPIISIISLTKDDNIGLKRTCSSVINQSIKEVIEWIVIDGSSDKCLKDNKEYITEIQKVLISNNRNIFIKYKDMSRTNIKGIYPSMNYSRTLIEGLSTIFLNGGDEFYNSNSLNILHQNFRNQPYKKVICFGQALIVSRIGLRWNFPGDNIHSIKKWLKYLVPNHQSMLVSSELVFNNEYPTDFVVEADNYWKRSIIKDSQSTIYIRNLVCKFYLGGASSTKPSIDFVISQILDKRHSITRKLVFIIKFLIPKYFYEYYPYFQKLKNDITNLIF